MNVFFVQVYFSNVTVSQTTVSTEPMKMFHLKHANCACQVLFTLCAGFQNLKTFFQVFSMLWLNMDGLKVNRFGRTYRT